MSHFFFFFRYWLQKNNEWRRLVSVYDQYNKHNSDQVQADRSFDPYIADSDLEYILLKRMNIYIILERINI